MDENFQDDEFEDFFDQELDNSSEEEENNFQDVDEEEENYQYVDEDEDEDEEEDSYMQDDFESLDSEPDMTDTYITQRTTARKKQNSTFNSAVQSKRETFPWEADNASVQDSPGRNHGKLVKENKKLRKILKDMGSYLNDIVGVVQTKMKIKKVPVQESSAAVVNEQMLTCMKKQSIYEKEKTKLEEKLRRFRDVSFMANLKVDISMKQRQVVELKKHVRELKRQQKNKEKELEASFVGKPRMVQQIDELTQELHLISEKVAKADLKSKQCKTAFINSRSQHKDLDERCTKLMTIYAHLKSETPSKPDKKEKSRVEEYNKLGKQLNVAKRSYAATMKKLKYKEQNVSAQWEEKRLEAEILRQKLELMSKELQHRQTQLSDITPSIASYDNQRRHRSHQPSVRTNNKRRKQSFSNSSKIFKEPIPELNGEESGTFVTIPKNSVSQSMFITQADSPIEPKPKPKVTQPVIKEEISMFNSKPNKELDKVKLEVKAAVEETHSVISNLSTKSIKSRRIRTPPREIQKTDFSSSFVPQPPSIPKVVEETPITPERTLTTQPPSQAEIPVIPSITEESKSPSPELKPVEMNMRPGRIRPTSFFKEDPKPVQNKPMMFNESPIQKPAADPFASLNNAPSGDLFSVQPTRQISNVSNENFDSFFKPKLSPAMSNDRFSQPAIQPMAISKPTQQAVEIEDLSFSRPVMKSSIPSQPVMKSSIPSQPVSKVMEIEDLSCEDLL